MSRRIVIKAAEIYRRRAQNWEWHYKNRAMARDLCLQLDAWKVYGVVSRCVPAPEMTVEGSIVRGMDTICGEWDAIDLLRLPRTFVNKELMCVWYWAELAWMEFVRQFQGLPEVDEDHYLFYDAERDAVLVVPMSSKPVRADALVVPTGEGKGVDKSGTSQVQVPSLRYKPGELVRRGGA